MKITTPANPMPVSAKARRIAWSTLAILTLGSSTAIGEIATHGSPASLPPVARPDPRRKIEPREHLALNGVDELWREVEDAIANIVTGSIETPDGQVVPIKRAITQFVRARSRAINKCEDDLYANVAQSLSALPESISITDSGTAWVGSSR